jgi:hypothetical protein
VARKGETWDAYRSLVGKPLGKHSLGIPQRRWEDDMSMDLRKAGYEN